MRYVVARIQMISWNGRWRQPRAIRSEDVKTAWKLRGTEMEIGKTSRRPFTAGEGEGGGTWRREGEQGTAASSGSSSRANAPRLIATEPDRLNCQLLKYSADGSHELECRWGARYWYCSKCSVINSRGAPHDQPLLDDHSNTPWRSP